MFWKSESGAVSIEFVLVAPVLASMVGLVVSTSSLYATATELQQISFELARMSVRYADPGRELAHVCNDLIEGHAEGAARYGYLISSENIRNIKCVGHEPSRTLSVSITYDLSDQPGSSVAEILGMEPGSFTRTAHIQI